MPDARTLISGEPGTYFVNDGSTVLYQLAVAGFNTCALCWQYAGQVARYWPIPLHRNCRCRQYLIKPGATAPNPFIDYQDVVSKFARPQQAALMGVSLFRLWTKGAISWEDAVTPGRIRSLAEVVSLKNLSVKAMTRAGVMPAIARQAHATVNTPAHVLAEQHRQRLIDRILAAGIPHEAMIRQLSERLAARASVAAGPSYVDRSGAIHPGIRGGMLHHLEGLRRTHTQELAGILAGVGAAATATRVAMGQAPVLSEPNRVLIAAEFGESAARSVSAFLAAVDERRRAGLAISEHAERLYRRYGGR